ncbi:MAG: pilus assembly protein [Rhodospirillales bacterium]|nr:pilus assembly protein [Rhodospirillales bacterium]
MAIRNFGRNLFRNQGGAAALEFAFIAPLFLVILMSGLEFGHMMWKRSTLQHAVEEAGRYAMAHPDAGSEAILDVARKNALGMNAEDPCLISLQTAAAQSSPAFVSIGTTCQQHFVFSGLLPFGPVMLNAQTRVPRLS